MKKQETIPKIVVIFPTKNEEDTIEHVIRTAKKSRYRPAVVVVDAYSSDNTVRIARDNGAKVIQQDDRMFPAKGIAMKKGIEKAISSNANIVLFLDADIKNLTPEWVDKLVDGCINCDMVRGYYQRHGRDAPVTKLIAKPMIQIFFPELSHFEQPLSGEVCARIEVWKRLLDQNPPDGWGVDVWFLIEAAMAGYQIKEIFLGIKEHTSFDDYREDVGKLAKMAEQVEFTIIKEALKHGRIDLHKDVKT
ncbi:MAG TPA: glycosyltransferase [Nitrososphaeraceae archaeon]|nr:glycosyltransferase [Nitrososphaeraceae archaeon]HJY15811.1 glycosyltransferase [Nitrososphaeraceae archaeon]